MTFINECGAVYMDDKKAHGVYSELRKNSKMEKLNEIKYS
jgi:hypothetical protein